MEVLVLIDFDGTMRDEMTVRTGDIVTNVTSASEEGWLEGELRGKRGIFPVNFVKEIPVYLIRDNKPEPRSIRKSKMMKLKRKCEVAFAYTPLSPDELELIAGETVEILREIEDGWWMGIKGGKVGAFPSNFVKEIFVIPKETNEGKSGKTRPKLADAVFRKETKQPQGTIVRNKDKCNVSECCQAMFDYTACTEDELNLRKGDIVSIISQETEDEGWWEGEVNGRRGFFPDNFVMVIPPTDLQSGTTSQPPARRGSERRSVKPDASAMEKGGPPKAKDEKPEGKDLRSNPPTKVKLPSLNKPGPPPPIKDKPNKVLPKTNGDAAPVSPKKENESGQFDGVDVNTEKLNHPTANRAKPPQRRPPSGLVTPASPSGTEQTEPDSSPKKSEEDKPSVLAKVAENVTPSLTKPEHPSKTSPPTRPALHGRATTQKEEASLDSLQAEIRELRMALELLQTRHERDMQEMKEELREERSKRMTLREEVESLRTKH